MPQDSGPIIDQRLVRALAHSSRIRILETLVDQKGLSLGQISERVEAAPANVNYHVNVLAEVGVIEGVSGGPGNGAAETLFRLTPRSPIGSQHWREISASMRSEISTALLRNILDKARSSRSDYEDRGA
ncbi:MAG TPA: helix-turn-helix domain-containing protein [Solirubrobacterales bacterium]|nr:helix-turn-helix domain-containing protein [Solirubrobacterales bacterium]